MQYISHVIKKLLKLREIIVLHSSDSNNTNIVQLRRFAGEKSLANTSVSSGESLIVDLDENKNINFTKYPMEIFGILLEAQTIKKKGWIKEDEFGWLIEPKAKSILYHQFFLPIRIQL